MRRLRTSLRNGRKRLNAPCRPTLVLRTAASFAFAALAATIAWFGIRINAWYGATLGKTAEASSLIAGLSVSADVLAFALPAGARALWVEGHLGAVEIKTGSRRIISYLLSPLLRYKQESLRER